MTPSLRVRYLIRFVALAYVLVLLVVPVGLILWRTFTPGFGQFFAWVSTPAAISALNLSVLVVAIVVPLNVIFGIPTALVLARKRRIGPYRLADDPDAAVRVKEMGVLARAGFSRDVAKQALDTSREDADNRIFELRR